MDEYIHCLNDYNLKGFDSFSFFHDDKKRKENSHGHLAIMSTDGFFNTIHTLTVGVYIYFGWWAQQVFPHNTINIPDFWNRPVNYSSISPSTDPYYTAAHTVQDCVIFLDKLNVFYIFFLFLCFYLMNLWLFSVWCVKAAAYLMSSVVLLCFYCFFFFMS